MRRVIDEGVVAELRLFIARNNDTLLKKVRKNISDTVKVPSATHFVAKAGPNGDTRTTRHKDEDALKNNTEFIDYLSEYAEIIGQPEPRYHFSSLKKQDCNNWIGRLSIKAEPGKKKNRVFAIFDGISQETLKPLHDALMKTLADIHEDCTYDQTKISHRIKQLDSNQFFGDSDLSQATDTIPRWVYVDILNQVKPELGTK